MKVLITGSAGMVGRHTIGYLSGHGHEPIGTDVAGGDHPGSVTDRSFVFGELAKLDFDAIVHLAGVTDIKKTIEDPHRCYEVNCFGTLNMLELGVRKRVRRFLFACYDEQTRVFTTRGLKRHTELNIGDLVFTLNPKGKIEMQPVNKIHVYPYEGRMIHFSGKRVDLLVTPNHKMFVQTPTKIHGRRVWRSVVESAELVARRSICRLRSGTWTGFPLEELQALTKQEITAEDLFYLIGIFVGDGHLDRTQYQVAKSGLSRVELIYARDEKGRSFSPPRISRKEYSYPRISFYIPSEDKCRPQVETVLKRSHVSWSGHKKCLYLNSDFLYKIFERCFQVGADLRNPRTKRIPRWMLGAPPELLRGLLRGLLDSDGGRGRMLTTVSPGLVEDVMELCAKIGSFTTSSLSHTISEIDGRKIESTCFRVGISSKAGTPMFGRTYGNVHEEDYAGKVFCIEVENHNFLVERGGKIAFSGNSSANVYGAPRKNPVEEDEPVSPRVPYDYSKAIGEVLARSYFETKNLPVAITRSWLLFGEHDVPNRAVPRFIAACLRNEPLNLFNSGRDTTSPSHAANYAKLVATILEKDSAVGETFNFGGYRSVSIRELAAMIKELTNSTSELVMLPPRSEQESQPQVSYPSVEKLKRVLGYAYELSLEEGLKRTIESYSKKG